MEIHGTPSQERARLFDEVNDYAAEAARAMNEVAKRG